MLRKRSPSLTRRGEDGTLDTEEERWRVAGAFLAGDVGAGEA